MADNYGVGNGGFWLKVPYTQNNLHYRGSSFGSFKDVMSELLRVLKAGLQATFPYMLFQPTIDSKETKVIMHCGVPKYFCKYSKFGGPPRHSDEGKRLFDFAIQVHRTLAEQCPNLILDGLMRVDIMELQDQTLVVNEVEGVDSNYSSSRFDSQCSTEVFLEGYWSNVIANCVKEFIG